MTIYNSAEYGIAGWCGIAGKIESREEWLAWAKGDAAMSAQLPTAKPNNIPSRMMRRFDGVGRCILTVSERCLHLLSGAPAVLAVSRHGDLPLLDKLIQNVRDNEDISPTIFSASVHNRYVGALGILTGYRGVCGAYSSRRDGFPLAVCEAVSLISRDEKLQVLVLAYEPEIPQAYQTVVSSVWPPHAVAFVLQKPMNDAPVYSLLRHDNTAPGDSGDGSCLPQLRAMLNCREQRDGFWAYQVNTG